MYDKKTTKQTAVLFLCLTINYAITITGTAASSDSFSVSNSSNPCHSSGICTSQNSDKVCTRCECESTRFGTFCENQLTKIDGQLLYKLVSSKNQIINLNITALEKLIQATVDKTHIVTTTLTSLTPPNVTFSFTMYLERPDDWQDYTNAKLLAGPLKAELSKKSSVESVFGPSLQIGFETIELDVDECLSNWSNCDFQARCINKDLGFECICNTGFKGDGITCKAITCNMNSAPSTPYLANRTITYVNGTTVQDPASNMTMPYSTTIKFTCTNRYFLEEISSGNTIGVLVTSCQADGWSGARVQCTMDLSFRIAIAITTVSSVVSLLLIICYISNWYAKIERKAKKKKAQGYDNHSYGNTIFDEV